MPQVVRKKSVTDFQGVPKLVKAEGTHPEPSFAGSNGSYRCRLGAGGHEKGGAFHIFSGVKHP